MPVLWFLYSSGAPCWRRMSVTLPVSSFEELLVDLAQPPKSAIVNRPGTSGNLSVFSASTDSVTGR